MKTFHGYTIKELRAASQRFGEPIGSQKLIKRMGGPKTKNPVNSNSPSASKAAPR